MDGVILKFGGPLFAGRQKGLEQGSIHAIAKLSNFNVVLQSRPLATGGMDCRAICQKCKETQTLNYDEVLDNKNWTELGIFCDKHRHDGISEPVFECDLLNNNTPNAIESLYKPKDLESYKDLLEEKKADKQKEYLQDQIEQQKLLIKNAKKKQSYFNGKNIKDDIAKKELALKNLQEAANKLPAPAPKPSNIVPIDSFTPKAVRQVPGLGPERVDIQQFSGRRFRDEV
jgi:hypothetical protein